MSALSIERLRIVSRLGAQERVITSGIDLQVAAGEAVAVVGESGSGKSMTARAVMGLLPTGVSASGRVVCGGRDLLGLSERELVKVRGTEIALIFQDPFTMLNPLMRCGEQISELLRDGDGKRLSRAARRTEAVRRIAELGIEDAAVADAYPFELSGGMRQRIGIAAALARDPQVVIADEPSTALDVTTQKEILARLREMQDARGMSLVLITHDLRVAFSTCDRVSVLYAGTVLENAASPELETTPRHPYSLGLLLSEPPVDRRLARMTAIEGTVPRADDVGDGCPFAPRCRWVEPDCLTAVPDAVGAPTVRWTACVRADEIAAELDAVHAEAASGTVADELAPSVTPLVSVVDVEKTYPGGARNRKVQALAEVSIEIGENECVGLVGESGSGKTTLGRSIVGLESVSGGRIVVDGIDATDYRAASPDDRERLRRTVQMIFQDPYSTLNPVRTIGATLQEAIGARANRVARPEQRARELLERVGLPAEYARRKPVALSGGERQRVAIARALAADPRLIVCDEAVSALDVSVQAQILNLLADLRRETGVSYLFITHDLAVARQVADRLYVLQRGRVVESGPTGRVLDRPEDPYTQTLVASIPGGSAASS